MRFNVVEKQFEELNTTPDKLAIAGSDFDCSWSTFKTLVDAKRELLLSLNIPKGHPVVVYGHKQVEFIVSVAACIQLELPYIPVDVLNPVDRINKIKEVTGSKVMINCFDQEPPVGFDIELRKGQVLTNNESEFGAAVYHREEDPIVYIIFTSGSTGEPKGVQITRSAVGSFQEWMEKDFGFDSSDVFVNQAPFSFDLSVYELMTFMHLGAGIILNQADDSKDPDVFLDRVQKYQGSIWVSTPSFAYIYLKVERFLEEQLPSLKHFLFCGESLPKRTASILLDIFPNGRVINTYGPTEATVATTIVDVTKEVLESHQEMPVGISKRDSELLIDNEANNPEEVGEIIIVGDNVTIGYFKNETLNAEKCFKHNGKRAFRTGDYGYLKNGMLFFAGRRDEQVKLNGYRIELGDITAHLEEMTLVNEAVTIPLRIKGEVKKIISFVTLKGEEKTEAIQQIDEELKEKIPYYMQPAKIIAIDELPVSSNHKIDKKKLTEMFMKGAFR